MRILKCLEFKIWIQHCLTHIDMHLFPHQITLFFSILFSVDSVQFKQHEYIMLSSWHCKQQEHMCGCDTINKQKIKWRKYTFLNLCPIYRELCIKHNGERKGVCSHSRHTVLKYFGPSVMIVPCDPPNANQNNPVCLLSIYVLLIGSGALHHHFQDEEFTLLTAALIQRIPWVFSWDTFLLSALIHIYFKWNQFFQSSF